MAESLVSVLKKGLISENPTFRLVLGMCPTLAITTSVVNAVGMGVAATAVLIVSNFLISLVKRLIPDKVRIPAYITIIAGVVSVIHLLMRAYTPDLNKALGIFIPLITVNCIILARAEMFASKNGVFLSIADGFAMGAGFTGAMVIISSVREILGAGTFLGMEIAGGHMLKTSALVLPVGGFLVLGLLMATVNKITEKSSQPKKSACDGCNLCFQKDLNKEKAK